MKKLTTKKIFLLGILIRLLIMPFFAHDDIFAEHRRAERIVCQGVNPLSYSSWGVRLLESGFTTLFTPFVSCDNLAQIQKSNTDIDNLNRMLFFFKLPYLLFEVGYWWLMYRLFQNKNQEKKKILVLFLALNPVIIYSVYMFGRFESYNLFLSALILFLLSRYDKSLQKKFIFLSTFVLAIILIIRFSYLLLIPAFIMSFGVATFPGALFILSFIVSFLVLKLPSMLFATQSTIFPEAAGIASGAHQNYVYHAGVSSAQHTIYIFFLLFSVIFVWWLQNESKLSKFSAQTKLALFSAATLLSFYATTYFHPQYFTWIMPFFAVLMVNDKTKFLWKSFWYLLPFYFIYILSWGNAAAFALASPISVVFNHIEPSWFLPILELDKWVNIARTFLTGFCLYWIYFLLKNYEKNS